MEKLQSCCTDSIWKKNVGRTFNLAKHPLNNYGLVLSELLSIIKTYYTFHNALLEDEIESCIVVSMKQ